VAQHGHERAKKEAARKEIAHKATAKVAVVAKPPPPPLPPDVGTNTGLHLPRYASLKSDDVNMRSGPGERYPVEWTYKRRDLPVKIEREFDVWRLVEDMDGIKGWVHQATLTGRRSFVITGTEDRTIRADASPTADAVAVLRPGVVGRIRACDATKDWCQVQVDDYRGWLQRGDFWGADAGEVITP
jgi:SH3-like domain-containing protein